MTRYVTGPIQARSPLFSRVWTFTGPSGPIGQATRSVIGRSSAIALPDGTRWSIKPAGWGHLVLTENGEEVGEATREGVSGRNWRVSGQSFSYDLGVDSMIRRRWQLGPVGSPIATLHGGMMSFNTMRIETGLPIPFEAIVLAWHPIVRAWEAASAAPGA
jgi:hypothetical protein